MRILSLHQDIFTWLRILPFANGTDLKIQYLSGIFLFFVILFQMLPFVSSVLYFHDNVITKSGDDFSICMCTITQLSGWGCNLYTLIVAYIVRDKLRNLFDKIQKIYDGWCFEIKQFLVYY